MCAIFGIYAVNKEELLKKISKSQLYRGPDEQNFYFEKEKPLFLGSNRLAVVDKAGGQQPMFSEDKNLIIVFNGCIFNFKEIRNFLEKKGIIFKTSSDTEVLIKSYSYFGEKCFNYFDGMWACAIYDKNTNSLILSRDYLGQKPLYYLFKRDYFVFSSQLNGFFHDKELKLTKDMIGTAKFFFHGFFPAPHTPFEEIKQLEPGSILKIDLSNLDYKKYFYWDITTGPDNNIFFKKKINKENFDTTFKKIIEDYSISDKKMALSLSGGVDSFLTSYFYTKVKGKTSSFSIGFKDKTYDESDVIKNIDINVEKKIFKIEKENLKNAFLSVLKMNLDPVGDSSMIPTFLLFEKIHTFSNVALTGDGGDEGFFGYIIFDGYKLGLILKKILPKFIIRFINLILSPLETTYDYMSLGKRIKIFFLGLNEPNEKLLANWICPLKLSEIEKNLKIKIDHDQFFQDIKKLYEFHDDKMKFAQIYMYKYYLPSILIKLDQASMANSVEARAPFLSKHIINYTLSGKTNKLFSIFKKKIFLLNNFSKIIPSLIKKSKKHGFAFKKEDLLKDEKFINKIINQKNLNNKEFFFRKYKEFLNHSRDNSNYLWHEIVLNNFYNKKDF